MHYTDFSIEMLLERLLTRSMADKTPKKYSTVMFESWEVIRQLQQELAATKQKLDELNTSIQNAPQECPNCGQPITMFQNRTTQKNQRR